jgi:hypothetical protein
MAPLGGAGKDHVVISDHGAAAQAGKADRTFCARAGVTVSGARGLFLKRNVARFGRGASEQQSGSGRRVDLCPVMHLDDLDIEVRQCPCRPPHQGCEQCHAEAHIARLDYDGVASGGADVPFVVLHKAGRADDVNDARLRRQRRKRDGNRWNGEVEQRVGLCQQGERIVAEHCSRRCNAGERASVLAEIAMAFGFERAGKHEAVGFANLAHQHASHAARSTRDDSSNRIHEIGSRSLAIFIWGPSKRLTQRSQRIR